MASQRQVDANRRNAKMSTGPRSSGGKARSRHNALTHGLTASHTSILPNEDPAAFDALCRAMLTNLTPDGPLEQQLVERAASLLWRLRRISAFEEAVFEWIKQVEGKGTDDKGDGFMPRSLELINDSSDTDRYSHASRDVLEVGRAFEIFLNTDLSYKLGRYETQLQRQLSATLKELRALQANCRALAKRIETPTQTLAPEPVPLPDRESLPASGRIIRRTRRPPVDFDHGVAEDWDSSSEPVARTQDDS